MKITAIILFNLFAFCSQAFADGFDIVTTESKVSIYYDTECKLDSISANLLASDIKLLSGYRPFTSGDITHAKGNIIVVGSINSKIIRQFRGKMDLENLKGKWECYGYRLIKAPTKNIRNALIIAGSDFRGTAYGVFDLSARLGISPWYWWADVTPAKRKSISITMEDYTSAPPSVKYRGVFINDEDWGLQPWAAKTFEPEIGDIGPKTYAKVFELLLRLKANLIWPAMHPSTKAFFRYPGNAETAVDYQIIIGSSHAEPMLRNNVGEWNEKTMGPFNYITNKESVYKYWEDRVKESSRLNAIYTIGMRGVHDSGMEGINKPKEAVPLLDNIFKDQREMLARNLKKDAVVIPQAFTAYKEVLDIYDQGLKVPDDVTLVWPDDNYGYIQRLNNEKERTRSGGAGVYYHASYWGRPHDYLWLSSTHPSLIREEMMKAYETGASRLWVLNVGDIKPLEYHIQFFMDMAYDASPFKQSRYTKQHLLQWTARLFGKEKAQMIQSILWEYYQLAFERRPEFMGWSQTEPTSPTRYTDFNHFYFGDEAQKRIDRYDTLEKEVKELRTRISPEDADAFFELVYYPVVGAAEMTKKFLYHDKAYYYGKQNRISAFDYAAMSEKAYNNIVKETAYYNTQLAGGRWNNIMSMKPRDLPIYQKLVLPSFSIDSTSTWNIAPEGYVTKDSSLLANVNSWALPAFDRFNKQKYFIDIFLNRHESIQWTASVSHKWIHLSKSTGLLIPEPGKKQMRIWIDIDWGKVTKNEKQEGTISFAADSKQIVVKIRANDINIPELTGFKGFIENNGFVSIYAANFTRRTNKLFGQWKVIDGLGYTRAALEALPLKVKGKSLTNPDSIKSNSSLAEYDFYAFSAASPFVYVLALPTHPINNNYNVRYAVSIDNGPLKMVDKKTFGRSEEWKQNVLRNRAERKIEMPFLNAGKHTLKIYYVDPGVILDEIRIDLGGLKKAYSSIPETQLK